MYEEFRKGAHSQIRCSAWTNNQYMYLGHLPGLLEKCTFADLIKNHSGQHQWCLTWYWFSFLVIFFSRFSYHEQFFFLLTENWNKLQIETVFKTNRIVAAIIFTRWLFSYIRSLNYQRLTPSYMYIPMIFWYMYVIRTRKEN